MKKLLALALFAAAGAAQAYTIDATVNWAGYTGTLTATGATGTLSAGQLLNDPVLPSSSNKTSFGVAFSIDAAPVVSGYTFDHIEWLAYGNTFAGGSATSTNPSGSLIEDLSSNTRLRIGTNWGGTQIGSVESKAIGSFIGDLHVVSSGDTLALGDDSDALNTGWITNNALSLLALASAANTFTSDGNADSSFSNYANVGVQARYVYTQDPVQVPEPASMALIGLGALGLAATRRRK